MSVFIEICIVFRQKVLCFAALFSPIFLPLKKFPAIYKDDKTQKDKNEKIDNQENINGNDFVEYGITSFSLESKLTEAVQNQSSAPSEVSTVNHKNEFCVGEKIDMEKIIKKLETLETEITEIKSAKETSEASEEKMKKQLETIENQFAKIQAENETLKETIKKILESQIVF